MEESLEKIIREEFDIPEKDIKSYSPLTLAYIGDAVYEIVIRTLVILQGNAAVNKLHKRTASLVKAPAQAHMLSELKTYLTEEEIAVAKRGRNAHSFTKAKNATAGEYRMATGFEALIGYLYLTDGFERILELIKKGLELTGK